MPKLKTPDVLILLEKGIPSLVRSRRGITVEVRDFETEGDDDANLPKDTNTGEPFYRHRWANGRTDNAKGA